MAKIKIVICIYFIPVWGYSIYDIRLFYDLVILLYDSNKGFGHDFLDKQK